MVVLSMSVGPILGEPELFHELTVYLLVLSLKGFINLQYPIA